MFTARILAVVLAVGLIVGVVGVLQAAVVVTNPSFEDDVFVGGNGPLAQVSQTAINGWTFGGNAMGVGQNPTWTDTTQTTVHAKPYINNNQIPDGKQVAFIRSGEFLSQDVGGFEAGKSYVVDFHANARNGNNNVHLTVTLGGHDVLAQPISPVGGSNAFHFLTTAPFGATAGTHTLRFSDTSGQSDQSVLLDQISIREVPSGPIRAHWAFDETAGQTAFDSTTSFDGTVGATGSPETNDPAINQPGMIGRAYQFTAAELDRVDLSSHVGSFAGETDGALSGWFQTTSADRGILFRFGESSEHDRLLVEMAGGQLRFLIREAATNVLDLTTTDTFHDGAWHQYAISQDGTAATMFIDGQPIASFSPGVNSGDWFSTVTNPDKMSIGWENRGGSTEIGFDGLLDDMAVWANPLSAGEAVGLYALGQNAELGYDASLAAQLFELHAAGPGGGFVQIGQRWWTYAAGLGGNPGDLTGSGLNFVLQIDASTGVQSGSMIIPEPATFLIWSLGLLGLIGCRRRRTK